MDNTSLALIVAAADVLPTS